MVWYRNHQLSYIITLWLQQWKMCVSSCWLHLLPHVEKCFTRGRDHLDLRSLGVFTLAKDNCRRWGEVQEWSRVRPSRAVWRINYDWLCNRSHVVTQYLSRKIRLSERLRRSALALDAVLSVTYFVWCWILV